MTALITSISAQRNSEMRRYAAERRRAEKARHGHPGRTAAQGAPDRLEIRRLDPSGADRESLVRLAGRDSSDVPAGESLGAEVDGRLIAAAPLNGEAAIADPFSRTADAVELLELRIAQLRCA